MEFEWKNFPGFTTLGILDKIQKMMTESKCEPEQFKGRIIFMPKDKDIDWTKRGNKEACIANALRVAEYARRFTEKKWYGTHVNKPDGEWAEVAGGMMLNFAEKRTPCILCWQRIRKRRTVSIGRGVKSIDFIGSDDIIELILRTIISVTQLSVHGAVADLCKELARNSRGTGKPAANENLESMVFPTEFSIANLFLRLMTKYKETCCVHTSRNSQNFLNNRNWPCSNAGLNIMSRVHLTSK